MFCAICYHLEKLINVNYIHGVVLSKTPPWVFLTFFKLYKWYQIAQNVSYWLVKGKGQVTSKLTYGRGTIKVKYSTES